jgi:thymidylate synthase ThyX
MYKVVVLADSVAPNGSRLFTVEATYPRFVHSELMTHRQFSRNAASSRAIPVEKTLARVWDEPATPISWGKNQKGMQAEEELLGVDLGFARSYWTEARNKAAQQADKMVKMGVHKQIVNRLLEPFVWMTTIISATDWANFFALRCHRDAQPEIREIADRIRYAYTYNATQARSPYKAAGTCRSCTREERRALTRRELLRKLSVPLAAPA